MRSFLRYLVLFTLLLAYGTQAVGHAQHLHHGEDRHHCTACTFGSLPGEPPTSVEEPLPPGLLRFAGEIRPRRLPPPRTLDVLDVSRSTSPPA